MPFATVDNIRLFYRLEGKADRPLLILSHSIGTDHGMWAPQMDDLLPIFRFCATTLADTAHPTRPRANTRLSGWGVT